VRVVSLVPSATESLLALGVTPLACTRWCEQPGIPTVGGTKNPDLEAVVALAPDLVVMNDEENRLDDHRALVAAGLRVHSMSPRSVADVGPEVAALAGIVGRPVPDPFGPPAWSAWLAATRHEPRAHRGAVLVWRRPWMTLASDTYGASVLDLLGVALVDVGGVATGGTDRYPEVALPGLAECGVDLVILPDEPYEFDDRHAAEVRDAIPGARVVFLDGRDLFWWGTRTPVACRRLAAALAG
jgi:ABC-type Fe3+-hydroxamate transport system substrate-binding protein